MQSKVFSAYSFIFHVHSAGTFVGTWLGSVACVDSTDLFASDTTRRASAQAQRDRRASLKYVNSYSTGSWPVRARVCWFN